jgi:GTPase KRas protein
LAHEFRCKFIETSARTAHNVERLFINAIGLLKQAAAATAQIKTEEKKKRLKCAVM